MPKHTAPPRVASLLRFSRQSSLIPALTYATPFAPLQTATLQATMAKLLTILTGGMLEMLRTWLFGQRPWP